MISGTLQKREGYPLESVHMFHAARYSDNLLSTLGGDFSKVLPLKYQVSFCRQIEQIYLNKSKLNESVLRSIYFTIK